MVYIWESTYIPRKEGVYTLIMQLAKSVYVEIGRLGRHKLLKGIYVYVGSARGRGGLHARIMRHLRRIKSIRWHIDYITVLDECTIKAVIYDLTREPDIESIISRKLMEYEKFEPAIKGFGASDKRDYTHLFKYIGDLESCYKDIALIFKDLGLDPKIYYVEER